MRQERYGRQHELCYWVLQKLACQLQVPLLCQRLRVRRKIVDKKALERRMFKLVNKVSPAHPSWYITVCISFIQCGANYPWCGLHGWLATKQFQCLSITYASQSQRPYIWWCTECSLSSTSHQPRRSFRFLGGHQQLCTMGTKTSSTMARCHIISSQRPTLQPLS